MAQITTTLSTLPEPPYKGVDLGASFVSKAESFRYALKYTFSVQLNAIIDEVNVVRDEINDFQSSASNSAAQALNYSNSALSYSDSALGYRNTALTYQTGAQSAYNSTRSLVNNLVIPISATYTYTEVDAKFVSETENFLNFKIGE